MNIYRLPACHFCVTLLLIGLGGFVSAQTVAMDGHASRVARQTQSEPSVRKQAALPGKPNQVGLRQILIELESTYGVRFNFRPAMVRDIRVNHVPMAEFDGRLVQRLNQLLLPAELYCATVGKSVFVLKERKPDVTPSDAPSTVAPNAVESVASATSQSIDQTITGIIRGEAGEGLPGVTVALKGTTRGTLTDENGKFQLAVPESGAVLVISYVGYTGQEIEIGNQTNLELTLQPDNKLLNEVVVVGYGTQKKTNLTGAVAVVQGETLSDRPVVNATQSLQGLVPGLNVTVGGNTRPGQSFNLNIRGLGNLSGSDDPYVLVDGFEMSLADVNPNDIESITVLKDAAASAIYGARAAYGVILVTTKKGSDKKVSVTYSGNVGATTPIRLPDMVNSLNFARYFNDATFNAMGTRQYSDEKLALLEQYIKDPTGITSYPEINRNSTYPGFENNANGVANTNWFHLHYKPYALRQTHNLSVSGGNKVTQYYVSGGYYHEDGSMRFADIGFNRYNLNANVTTQAAKWLKIRVDTKYMQSRYETPFSDDNFENNFFNGLSRMRPNFSAYGLNGDWSEASMVPYLQSGSNRQIDNTTLNLIGGLELEPVKDWKIFANLNLRQNGSEVSSLKLPGTIYGIDGTPVLVNRTEYVIPLKGSFGRTTGNSTYFSPFIYSTYERTLGGNHNLALTVGYQRESFEFKNLSANSLDLISPSRPGIDLVTGDKTVTETRNHWATAGAFGRFTYNYKEKFLFEVNGRYDGSSRFAADSRWGFFPSFSAGYNLGREPFMERVAPWISTMKFRASYGILGNQAGAGLYSFSENMDIVVPRLGAGGRWYFEDSREAFINAPGAFNPNITWERVESTNFGLDLAAFENRLSGNLDIYQRSTRDMLGPSLDIADLYGANPPRSNNADLRTRGWELALNWRGKINPQIDYTLGGVMSDYIAVVTRYQNPTKFNPANAWYEGKRAGEIWGYRADGLLQTTDEAAAYNKLDLSYLTPRAWMPGDVKYLDLNGDGKIDNGTRRVGDTGDLTIIGNTTPRYSYSFNGSVSWKGLSLYTLWQGIGKRDFSPSKVDAYFWGAASLAQVTVFREHLDYWTPENPNAYYPRPYASAVGAILSHVNKTQQDSDRYLQNAAYLRLKNITLSYTLPTSISSRAKITKANIFLTGENVFTFTKLGKMFDPETLLGAAGTGKLYPLSKVYSAGVRISL